MAIPYYDMPLSDAKIDIILNALKQKASYNKMIHKIILFGSCARKEYVSGSDIDILLLVDDRLSDYDKNEIALDISSDLFIEYGEDVSIICVGENFYNKNKTWYKFYQNVEKDGIIYG